MAPTAKAKALASPNSNSTATSPGTLKGELVAQLCQDRALFAEADPDLVRTVLINLLSNAFKFTANRPAPRIDFSSETQDDDVVNYAGDNGAGFDMAYIDTIFRPFERLHLPRRVPGTGIGLATVHRAMRKHGGRVWAEAAVDHGAIFVLTLKQRALPRSSLAQSRPD